MILLLMCYLNFLVWGYSVSHMWCLSFFRMVFRLTSSDGIFFYVEDNAIFDMGLLRQLFDPYFGVDADFVPRLLPIPGPYTIPHGPDLVSLPVVGDKLASVIAFYEHHA